MLKDANHSYFAGVYIVCGYTDLRFGIDSLAAIIERRFHMTLVVPNTLFLFCGRSSTKIKGLLWEGNGFLLLYKRVESGHFTWPRSSNDLSSLSAEQFHWLMQGFAIEPVIHDITPDTSTWFWYFCAKQRTLFPVLSHVFHVLCTASRHFLMSTKRHPKRCTALFLFYFIPFSIFSYLSFSAIVIFTFPPFS